MKGLIRRLVLAAVLGSPLAVHAEQDPQPFVGLEGRAAVVLPRPDYQPRPVDDRTDLILRIEGVKPAGPDAWTYDLYFVGLEPRAYPLSSYLLHPDGTAADELTGVTVRVASLLPEEHDGSLVPQVQRALPWMGGYRIGLLLLGALWIGGLLYFVLANRKKRVPPPPPPLPPPSLAERLRPLVEAAAAGRLDVAGQAALERMLMAFWRDRLHLPADLPMPVQLARLKADPEAGALLRALEEWLHSPRGATADDVRRVLAPYAAVPAPEAGRP